MNKTELLFSYGTLQKSQVQLESFGLKIINRDLMTEMDRLDDR